ncbi:MAG: aminotransferase class I/II-fold pyridoxal phosphate-dependent enzyme, partial [Pseudomonadota bacterium]
REGDMFVHVAFPGFEFRTPAEIAPALYDRTLTVNGVSKAYAMTGWRIGWMVLPETLVRSVERLAQNFFISAPTLSQIAAEAALDAADELEGHRGVYARNRSAMLAGLDAMGITRRVPSDGAFYVYADVAHLTEDAEIFAQDLLHEAGVATAPGNDFDAARGHSFLRLSYARGEAHVAAAIERMGNWLATRAP